MALSVHTSPHAINAKYRQQLERSGCTQASEAQGCDITKTKEENAKAGFDCAAALSLNTLDVDINTIIRNEHSTNSNAIFSQGVML
jgi:hypothetical protein